jgi:hypothetical protein
MRVARFRFSADVSSENLDGVGQVLRGLADCEVTGTPDGWHVDGFMEGEDARDVNRRLLSPLRRVERRTRLRAEWSGEGSVYRFFDYALKSQRSSAE